MSKTSLYKVILNFNAANKYFLFVVLRVKTCHSKIFPLYSFNKTLFQNYYTVQPQ